MSSLDTPRAAAAQRQTVLRALDLYVAHEIDFEDALIVAHMERQTIRDVYSYDRDFHYRTLAEAPSTRRPQAAHQDASAHLGEKASSSA